MSKQSKSFQDNMFLYIIAGVVIVVLGGWLLLLIQKTSSTPNQVTKINPTKISVYQPTSINKPILNSNITESPSSIITSALSSSQEVESYFASQPGSGCDKQGAIWTPQGIDSFYCGTTLNVSAFHTRGYLYFQLPNNKDFSANNLISISADINGNDCVGLQEEDEHRGYLGEYCAGGVWTIYSISTDGTILQTLAHNITAANYSQTVSLKLQGRTLTFTIGTDAPDTHEITTSSPISPTKIAIVYNHTNATVSEISISNFRYTPIK